jgi:transposase
LIKQHLKYKGYFILITNHETNAVKSLEIYRNKDCVEKDFQNLKSCLSFDRVRTHNSDTTIGRVFIAFLTLIIKCYMDYIMKITKLNKEFSFKSMMFELQKLKIITFKKDNPIFSEISKKVKIIFKAFDVELPKNLY